MFSKINFYIKNVKIVYKEHIIYTLLIKLISANNVIIKELVIVTWI